MLILILIDVQYLQNLVFSFEKGLNVQNHSLPDSHHSIKKFPQQNFLFPTKCIFLLTPYHYLGNTYDDGYTALSKTEKFHGNHNPVIQQKEI